MTHTDAVSSQPGSRPVSADLSPEGQPPVASWFSPQVEVRESGLHGRGLIVREQLRAGDVIGAKGGHQLSRSELLATPIFERHAELQIGDDLFLSALDEDGLEQSMMYVNHSCAPNAGVVGLGVVVALRDLQPGDEIFDDYGTFNTYDGFVLACACGAATCRGLVTPRDWTLAAVHRVAGDAWPGYLLPRVHALSAWTAAFVEGVSTLLESGGLSADERDSWWQAQLAILKRPGRASSRVSRAQVVEDGDALLTWLSAGRYWTGPAMFASDAAAEQRWLALSGPARTALAASLPKFAEARRVELLDLLTLPGDGQATPTAGELVPLASIDLTAPRWREPAGGTPRSSAATA